MVPSRWERGVDVLTGAVQKNHVMQLFWLSMSTTSPIFRQVHSTILHFCEPFVRWKLGQIPVWHSRWTIAMKVECKFNRLGRSHIVQISTFAAHPNTLHIIPKISPCNHSLWQLSEDLFPFLLYTALYKSDLIQSSGGVGHRAWKLDSHFYTLPIFLHSPVSLFIPT